MPPKRPPKATAAAAKKKKKAARVASTAKSTRAAARATTAARSHVASSKTRPGGKAATRRAPPARRAVKRARSPTPSPKSSAATSPTSRRASATSTSTSTSTSKIVSSLSSSFAADGTAPAPSGSLPATSSPRSPVLSLNAHSPPSPIGTDRARAGADSLAPGTPGSVGKEESPEALTASSDSRRHSGGWTAAPAAAHGTVVKALFTPAEDSGWTLFVDDASRGSHAADREGSQTSGGAAPRPLAAPSSSSAAAPAEGAAAVESSTPTVLSSSHFLSMSDADGAPTQNTQAAERADSPALTPRRQHQTPAHGCARPEVLLSPTPVAPAATLPSRADSVNVAPAEKAAMALPTLLPAHGVPSPPVSAVATRTPSPSVTHLRLHGGSTSRPRSPPSTRGSSASNLLRPPAKPFPSTPPSQIARAAPLDNSHSHNSSGPAPAGECTQVLSARPDRLPPPPSSASPSLPLVGGPAAGPSPTSSRLSTQIITRAAASRPAASPGTLWICLDDEDDKDLQEPTSPTSPTLRHIRIEPAALVTAPRALGAAAVGPWSGSGAAVARHGPLEASPSPLVAASGTRGVEGGGARDGEGKGEEKASRHVSGGGGASDSSSILPDARPADAATQPLFSEVSDVAARSRRVFSLTNGAHAATPAGRADGADNSSPGSNMESSPQPPMAVATVAASQGTISQMLSPTFRQRRATLHSLSPRTFIRLDDDDDDEDEEKEKEKEKEKVHGNADADSTHGSHGAEKGTAQRAQPARDGYATSPRTPCTDANDSFHRDASVYAMSITSTATLAYVDDVKGPVHRRDSSSSSSSSNSHSDSGSQDEEIPIARLPLRSPAAGGSPLPTREPASRGDSRPASLASRPSAFRYVVDDDEDEDEGNANSKKNGNRVGDDAASVLATTAEGRGSTLASPRDAPDAPQSPTRTVKNFIFSAQCGVGSPLFPHDTGAAEPEGRPVEKLRPFYPTRFTRKTFDDAAKRVIAPEHFLEPGQFWDAFASAEFVGEGSFGLVWRCRTIDGDLVAVKTCPVSLAAKANIEDAFTTLREIAVMQFLAEMRVPYVLPLHSAFLVREREALPPVAAEAMRWRQTLRRRAEATALERQVRLLSASGRVGRARRGARAPAKAPHGSADTSTIEDDVAVALREMEAAESADERAQRARLSGVRLPRFLSISEMDVTQCDATVILVTELCDGDVEGIPRADGVAKGVAYCVSSALASMHALGLLHLDLKPSNILFAYEHGPSQPPPPSRGSAAATGTHTVTATTAAQAVKFCLSDFGNCQIVGPRATDTVSDVFGTFEYMDLRALRDATCDRATDAYSLGCSLYEMLFGQRVYPKCTDPKCLSDEDHTRACFVAAAAQPIVLPILPAAVSPDARSSSGSGSGGAPPLHPFPHAAAQGPKVPLTALQKLTAALLRFDRSARMTAAQCRDHLVRVYSIAPSCDAADDGDNNGASASV